MFVLLGERADKALLLPGFEVAQSNTQDLFGILEIQEHLVAEAGGESPVAFMRVLD